MRNVAIVIAMMIGCSSSEPSAGARVTVDRNEDLDELQFSIFAGVCSVEAFAKECGPEPSPS